MFSLLVKNALVYDGSGAPPYKADVAVQGDKIADIAPSINAPAEKIIDAKGLALSPGFIDIHSHEYGIFGNPSAASKIHDGVTTEVIGNCGFSPFPGTYEGVTVNTAAEFFAAVDKAGSSINHACLAGLGAVRQAVMGGTARPANQAEIDAMKSLVEQSLDEGVFGVSTGLIYPPGCFATKEELAEVVSPAGKRGAIYATHMRSEGDRIEDAIDEAGFIAEKSGASLQISHLKLSGKRNWHKLEWLEKRLAELRRRVSLGSDRYTYTASWTNIGAILPEWVFDGNDADRDKRLLDRATRKKIEDEVLALHPEPEYFDNIVVNHIPDVRSPHLIGKSIKEIAKIQKEKPIDCVINLIAKCNSMPSAFFHTMNDEQISEILSWDFVAIGSDAQARPLDDEADGELPHPRAFGTFSRFLAKYIREQKLMPLEQGVRRMTALPAERLGMNGRGAIKKNYFADILIFDPEKVADRATYQQPRKTSVGIMHVIVNGTPVIENATHNGKTPGKILRRIYS